MNPSIEEFLIDGCMRCKLGGTPDCKVHTWTAELPLLRKIVLDSGLSEELKWGFPCYTFNNGNVLMIGVFNDFCSLSFFKGELLKDKAGVLHKPGENSQAVRLFKFTDVREIEAMETLMKATILEAIEIEKTGLKVAFKKNPEPIPDELQHKLDEDLVFRTAFESLTPGRQRGYILHFSQPKQSGTRTSRIKKCTPKILNGEGMHDHYRSMKK